MEGNGKWIRNDCSRSICWQCAKQKKSSARSSSTRTVPERCEAGRTRGGEHHGATHRGPDWLWLIQRQTSPVNWDTKSNTKELMPRRADELRTTSMTESAALFPETFVPFVKWIRGFSSLAQVHSFSWNTCVSTCFWIQSNLSQQRLVDLSTRDSVLCLEQSTKSLPCPLTKTYRHQILFVWGHDPSTHVRGATEGWDQKTPLRRGGTLKGGQTPTEQEDQKVHQRQKKNETTRKDTADSGGIHRHQKFFHAQHLEGKERSSRRWKNDKGETITFRKGVAKCLRSILQQAVCRKSAWRRSTRPSKPGNKNEHWAEKLLRRPEKWNTRVHTSWNTSCHW